MLTLAVQSVASSDCNPEGDQNAAPQFCTAWKTLALDEEFSRFTLIRNIAAQLQKERDGAPVHYAV